MDVVVPERSFRVCEGIHKVVHCSENKAVYALQAIFYSFCNTGAYLGDGVYRLSKNIFCCKFKNGLCELGESFVDAGKSLAFIILGVVMFVTNYFRWDSWRVFLSPAPSDAGSKQPVELSEIESDGDISGSNLTSSSSEIEELPENEMQVSVRGPRDPVSFNVQRGEQRYRVTIERSLLSEEWFRNMVAGYLQRGSQTTSQTQRLLLPTASSSGVSIEDEFDEAEVMQEDPRLLCRAKIQKFRSPNEYLDSECIRLWAERLGIEVVTNALHSFPIGEDLWKIREGYVYIPLILRSKWAFIGGVDHIVILRLNFDTRSIEYYNSQGKITAEREDRIVKGLEIPLNQFIRREGWQVASFKGVHQSDWYSCGVYVCWFMKMRERIDTFEEIMSCRLRSPQGERMDMAIELEDYFFPEERVSEKSWEMVDRVERKHLPIKKTVSLGGLFSAWVYDGNHPSKLHKYRLALQMYEHFCPFRFEGNDSRTQYHNFVQWLDTLSLEEGGSIAYARWTELRMTGYFQGIVELMIEACGRESGIRYEIPKVLTLERFSQEMRNVNQLVKEAPQTVKKPILHLRKQQLLGALGLSNFTEGENVPNRLADLVYQKGGEEMRITYLRHASPTQPGSALWVAPATAVRGGLKLLGYRGEFSNGETIVENYKTFLKEAGTKNEKVLFFIHQRPWPDVVEDESGRVRAILDLQREFKNFCAITQPLEGSLFERKGKYANVTTFAGLREGIVKEFGEVGSIFDVMHHIFFEGKSNVTRDEWQTAILLFYVFQKIEVKSTFKPTYYVTACKEMLDRGGMMALVELVVHLIWAGQEEDSNTLHKILYNILGAPIAAKRKQMLENRLEPGLKVIEFLAGNEGVKARLREHSFNGWKASRVVIEDTPNQKACPILADIKIEGELRAFLNCLSVTDVNTKREVPFTQFDLDRGQIVKDLPRMYIEHKGVRYDGTEGKGIDELIGQVSDTVVAFCQQGLFAESLMYLRSMLGIQGMDSRFVLGDKRDEVSHYLISSESTIVANHEFELCPTDEIGNKGVPIAHIGVEVKVDVAQQKMYSEWRLFAIEGGA